MDVVTFKNNPQHFEIPMASDKTVILYRLHTLTHRHVYKRLSDGNLPQR